MTASGPSPAFSLTLLGGFALRRADGGAVSLPTRKAEALLAYLALPAGMAHPREKLASLLWGDRGEEQARGSLRNTLAAIRAALAAENLVSGRDTVMLQPGVLDCDVERLERNADLDAALRGELLAGLHPPSEEFGQWLEFERNRCRGLAVTALRHVIDRRASEQAYSEAVTLARHLVALDPLREQSHRQLMRLLASSGERALALAQFQACNEILKRDLGVEPSPETIELASSLSSTADVATAAPPQARPRQTKARPVIAVLPFDDLGGDPSQRYFSEGMSQDIADRLSRYRILSVVGYHSASAMHQRALQLRELRKLLGIDYAVTGNIRKGDGRLRVAARLIDARNETTVWAQHYERPLEDILAIQDEVSNIIANTLVGQLESEYGMRGSFSDPHELTSYELVLQGIWHFRGLSMPGTALAMDCFKRAIEANPGNAEAHKWLSSCHLNDWMSDFAQEKLAASIAIGRRAIALDPANAKCHSALSLPLVYAEGTMVASSVLERAYTLNPGDPDVLCEMGLFKAYEGELAASHAFHLRALGLNPFPPAWYADMHGVTYFAEGRYADALPGFAALDDEYGWDAMYALSCLGHLGQREEALALRAQIEAKYRGLDLLAAAGNEPFTSAEPLHRLQEGLAIAYAFA